MLCLLHFPNQNERRQQVSSRSAAVHQTTSDAAAADSGDGQKPRRMRKMGFSGIQHIARTYIVDVIMSHQRRLEVSAKVSTKYLENVETNQSGTNIPIKWNRALEINHRFYEGFRGKEICAKEYSVSFWRSYK